MTKKEYREYQRAVEAFFEREGITNLSVIEQDSEPYFSWQPCDCCGSGLGGDREGCNGYNPTSKDIQGPYAVCVDCIYYNEYGQLDDMTMLEIEEDI